MPHCIEDLEDQSRFREILKLPYEDIVTFVLDYIRRKTGLILFFWAFCILLGITALNIRLHLSGWFPFRSILLHTSLGLIIFPLFSIPFHELLHVIPFLITGARKIRVGIDIKQYIFYVTAHRHVVSRKQFWLIGLTPFIIITVSLIILIILLPGLWKWSISLFLFVHTTMCAGDFAMLNFFWINNKKNIFTWDDADKKMAYFYEEI